MTKRLTSAVAKQGISKDTLTAFIKKALPLRGNIELKLTTVKSEGKEWIALMIREQDKSEPSKT